MTSLSALFEAAKAVEYDKDEPVPGKETPPKKSRLERERMININNRQTHNILEKNRRAELKNFFQRLKESVPKLYEKPKASNVSILTEAMKYIMDLNETGKQNEIELVRLRRCRMCLEERVKMLKEEIHRQKLQKQLSAQVDEEKKRATSPTHPKEMMSVEVQANEYDIRAAFPEVFSNNSKNHKKNFQSRKISVETQHNCSDEHNLQMFSEEDGSENNLEYSPGKRGRLKNSINSEFVVKIKPRFSTPSNKTLESKEFSQQDSNLDFPMLPQSNKLKHQNENNFHDCEETDSENENDLKIVVDDP